MTKRKVHFPSLRKVVVLRLMADKDKRPIFTVDGLCEAIVYDYVKEAKNAGHYARAHKSKFLVGKLKIPTTTVLKNMGYTQDVYTRYRPRVGRYGVFIRKGHWFWKKEGWELPPYIKRQANRRQKDANE